MCAAAIIVLALAAQVFATSAQDVNSVQSVQSVQSVKAKEFQCPEDFGVFADPRQCDKFWECDEGFARARLCDDGLVFDSVKAIAGHADPCDSPYVVDCGERLDLQPPTFVSDFCPRRNGAFADPDPSVCDVYYTCISGSHSKTTCSAGLHYDENSGTCTWPLTAQRAGCKAKTKECLGQFCCPDKTIVDAQGIALPHPTFPNLNDCQKFYVCLNAITPQEGSCSLGEVFNEKSFKCDQPENVPECENWYRDNPLFEAVYEDADNDGQIDFGKRRDFSQTAIN